MEQEPPPAPAPAPPPSAPAERLRDAAVVGALASLLFLASYFLPWISVPPEQRPRIREAIAPGIDDLTKTHPDLAKDFRTLLDSVAGTGKVGAIDLFLYARSARRLNVVIEPERELDSRSRPLVVRRAFLVAAVVLAVLPVLAVLLALHFLVHRFRRARSPVLILLILAGGAGTAVTVAWYAVARALPLHESTGIGMRMALLGAASQACAGIVGVTGRNWWRVYAGSLATLAAVAFLLWAYVTTGARP